MTNHFPQELRNLKQDSFITRLDTLGVNQNFFKANAETVQDTLAPILRKRAVEHLRTAQTVAAKGFRGEHLAAGEGPFEDYLQKQSQNGAWGTDLEAIALGESLGCNIVVTSINSKRANATWPLHFESTDAPTIHLYNDNNYHWTNDPDSWTKGEGNCLYNAFAKAMQQQVNEQSTITSASPTASLHSFLYNEKQAAAEKKILAKQELIQAAIQTAIKNHQTPAEREQQYQEEQQRLSALPSSEREQIAADYRLALKLAQDINPSDDQDTLTYF